MTAKNIRPWGLDLSDITFVDRETHEAIYKRCPVEFEDVLYIKDGVTTGLAVVNPLHDPFSTLSSVALLKPERDVLSPYFLMHWLNSPETFRVLTADMTGSAIRRLVLKRIRSATVALPPLNEQRRIVTKIEALQERSRKARTALEAIPPLLENFRRSVLAAAFRGDLTADWRARHPDVEPASVLLERILAERRRRWEEAELAKMAAKGKAPKNDKWKSKYKEPLPLSVEGLPELPVGWCWTTLDQLSWDSGYGTSVRCSYESSGAPVLRIPNVKKGHLDLGDLKFAPHDFALDASKALNSGDFLIVRTNGSPKLIGRGCLVASEPETWPQYFASYLIRFRFVPVKSGGLVGNWVNYYWETPALRRYLQVLAKTSAGQYNLSMTSLAPVPIPLAPEAEMALSNRLLGTAFKHLNDLDALQSMQRSSLDDFERAILRRAFEGRLVPQDPNDEPASVLLERIRKAREAETPKKTRRKTKR